MFDVVKRIFPWMVLFALCLLFWAGVLWIFFQFDLWIFIVLAVVGAFLGILPGAMCINSGRISAEEERRQYEQKPEQK